MNNCLITRLNGVVNNDNIEKFGQFSFDGEVTTGTTHFKVSGSNVVFDKDALINGTLVLAGTPISLQDGNTFSLQTAGDFECTILDKYNVQIINAYESSGISFDEIPVKTFEYFVKLKEIYARLTGNVGAISTLASSLKRITDYGGKMVFSGEELNAFTRLTHFFSGQGENANVNSNVHNLNLTSLLSLSVGYMSEITVEDLLNIAKNTGLEYLLIPLTALDNVRSFAAEQVRLGRTSGTLSVNRVGSSAKTIQYGTSMVNPTEEETTKGYQIV